MAYKDEYIGRSFMGRMSSLETIREVTIDRMALAGEGQGILEGKPVFVFNALPGERVQARIIERNRNHLRAEAVRIVAPSPHRILPPCPAYGICSGCNLMHLSYPQQLVYKQGLVRQALQQIGGFSKIAVSPCLPSPEIFAYRNKVQVPVRAVGGKARIGFFSRDSRNVIPLETCPVHCGLGDQAYRTIKGLIGDLKISAYDDLSCRGSLRHVLVRTACNRGESLACLVLAEKPGNKIVSLAQSLMARLPQIKGVVQNFNPACGDVILGRDTLPLAGQCFVTEDILGLQFRIAAPSFFQVNTAQIPTIYKLVERFLGKASRGILLDAYSGVGVFSLLLARSAKKVLGIEAMREAVRDAHTNASLNKIANTRFLAGRVERIFPKLEKIDGVILDPPRTGCDPAVLRILQRIRPFSIVYISCNPASLARDLKAISKYYRTETVQPVDMFPQTGHVETVVGLKRRDKRE